MDYAHQGAANAPYDHHRGDPYPGPEALHAHVGWDFRYDVEGKEYGECVVVHYT